MFNLVLYEPRIPQNCGNIIRLAANTGCHLHLIEPLGFDLEEKSLRRAGLDYAALAQVSCHRSWDAFSEQRQRGTLWALTTKGQQRYDRATYAAGDWLLFGSETAGLPVAIHQQLEPAQRLYLPMQPQNRSLNLANVVAIVTYEAWRQHHFSSAAEKP